MIGLGGASTMGIGLAVTLQNYFTGPAAAVNQSMLQLSGNSAKVAAQNTAIAQQVAGAYVATGVAITYGMSRAVGAFAEYEHAINKVQVISGMTNREMEGLRKKSESQMALSSQLAGESGERKG